ncbi:hypothetical protein GCM10009785_16710 [Brooklawnia cerclae]|uniref:Uncharacterized protein n=1 Tax=Brooklawnia cerclae TaxID=349934 RepID=A0ABX0SHE0_9ACTN|nr:hypothetical protein [Brooklawnia cerclae]NIH57759.1 hypothetical protein [Brooklawnia cerclae]
MYYSAPYLATGASDLLALRGDVSQASAFATTHLSKVSASDGGLIYRHFLGGHEDAMAKLDGLLDAIHKLLGNSADRIDETMLAYSSTEQANLDEVEKLWEALDNAPDIPPLGPPPDGGLTAGPLPSSGLATPETNIGHWIFDVLSWPDYLSIGSWLRKIFGWIWQAVAGDDPWQMLWKWLGGDFEAIGLAAGAWQELGDWFDDMAGELGVRMQIMFGGWYDSTDATAAGSYFAQATQAIAAAEGPMDDLFRLYNDVAWSSYGFFQAIYSLIDAAIDALVATLMGGTSVLEAIAAVFSGGATAVPAAASAIIAAVETLSAAWGYMMTAVYGVVGIGALVGAATTQIEWVAIPEG